MKRFLLLVVAALAFVGCNNAFEDEGNAHQMITDLPTLIAGFEEDTRTYVEQNTYLRWHADDRLTIFYGNTMNRQYRFNGKSGDNSGSFSHIPSGNIETGNSFDHIYAVYPYDATISLDDINKSMSLTLPAEHTYAEDSFGKCANTMVAITESVNDTFLSFKNVGGYLKVKLYSDAAAVVKSITIRGNNGEKVSGAATVAMTYGETPQLTMATGAIGSITLDCGSGVMLSSDAENPTEFWFVVPPMEFSKGITISVTNAYNAVFEKSTSNKIVVERNIIQPMSAVEVEFEEVTKPANNEIWYTATEKVEPYYDDEFGATLLSNIYDPTTKEGVLTFDSDVTQIGYKAFYDCDSLTSITIPDSVTTIGDWAFYGCDSLTSITIGDSVTTIGDSAFCGCDSLTSVTIGDSVTTIGNDAFNSCKSLTSVTIPDSVTTIGKYAFYSCDSLTSVTIGDSVTTIGEYAFAHCDSLTSVTIGDSVTTIGKWAFGCCHNLTSITIPNSVTTIGDEAFCYCGSLASVTIGDSVTTIGVGAFSNCGSLKEFKGKYATDNGRCLIKDNTIIAYAYASGTEYTIPNSVTTIGESTFDGCDSLTSVTIGDSVTTIGKWAFYDCDGLTSVTIGDSVTTIGNSAFHNCGSLTSVTIGDSVTTIGVGAFSNCGSLTSVTIGDSVTTIGKEAFSRCEKLKFVYSKPTTPPSLGSYAFGGTNIRMVYVPSGCVDIYKNSEWGNVCSNWEEYNFE